MKKLLLLLLFLALLPLTALADSQAAPGATLKVTGAASVSLTADHARVTVGVRTASETIDAASAENGAAIHSVIAALQEAGVAEEDIATSNYSVSAEYDYSTGVQKLIGYSVTNQLTVIIRDMDHIGAVLDQATRAGANSIYNIEFLSTASAQAQDEASAHAVQDAIRKAALLAEAAGLEVGSILSIEEATSGYIVASRTYDSAAQAKATSNVILPDQMTVSASVTIVFELK